MDAKRALEAANGDFNAAVKILHEKGASKLEKRSDRATGSGLIHSYLHGERIGVLVDVRAETDFVVRSDPFRALAHEVAMQIAAMNPATVEELLGQPYIKDPSRTVQDLVTDVVAKVGENVRVQSFSRMEV